jgi:malate dehydrogenase (oxaloacetate-decarboxylating)
MMMAAAHALAAAVDAKEKGDRLLPPLTEIRDVSRKIALAVGKRAQEEGLAPPTSVAELEAAVDATMWEARYRPYVAAG